MNTASRFTVRTYLLLGWLAVACLAVSPLAPVQAQSLEQTTSLRFAPADAAFYMTLLRGREQYDAFVNSKAFAKLKEMPIVQMGIGMLQQQWNDPNGDWAEFKELADQPENRQLVDLLIDGISHEVFVYGDEGYANLLALINDMNRAQRQAQIAALNDGDPGQAVVQGLLQALSKHLDTLRTPETVIGFRISNKQAAQAQIARLERELRNALAEQPDLVARLAHEQIGGQDFLTWKLDGSLIPWDALPPDFAPAKDKISKMTVSISLGVYSDYLLLSLGTDNSHLASLGKGPLLISRKELAPLKPHLKERVVAISYASEAFITKANNTSEQIDDLVTWGEMLLPLAGLDSDLQNEIVTDARKLATDIKSVIPRAGAVSGVGFLTDQGYEGYAYDWGENKSLDGSKPLTILNHVGGDPLFFAAGRAKYAPENYDTASKWLGRILYYAEKIGVERLGPNEREFYDAVRGDLQPLIVRLDQVTRDKLVPAFRDGQGAVVLDAKAMSDKWHEALPPAPQPLPMLELALVYTVSDVEMLKAAASEYFDIIQEALDVLHKAKPEEIPELKVPPPQKRDFPAGTVYYYPLPAFAGIDKQIAPNAGLSKDTLALSLVPKQTVRLLESKPPVADGILQNTNRPLASALRFNFAGLLDAIAPWIDYGISLSEDENLGPDVQEQIHTGISILKCFRGASAVTYQEGDTWVTHTELRFQDLR